MEPTKDLKLFEALRNLDRGQTSDIQKRIYPNPKPDAYYQLRKTLHELVEEFVLLELNRNDRIGHIMKLILLARFCLIQGNYKLGWNYLNKSEKMAQDHKEFELLHYILKMQLDHCGEPQAPEIQSIIQKRQANWKILAALEGLYPVPGKDQELSLHDPGLHASYPQKRSVEYVLELFNVPPKGKPNGFYECLKLNNAQLNQLFFSVQDQHREPGRKKSYSMKHVQLDLATALYKIRCTQCSPRLLEELSPLFAQEDHPRGYLPVAFKMSIGLMHIAALLLSDKIEEARSMSLIFKEKYGSKFNVESRVLFLNIEMVISLLQGCSAQVIPSLEAFVSRARLGKKILGESSFLDYELFQTAFFWENQDYDLVNCRIRSIRRRYSKLLKSEEAYRQRIFLSILYRLNLDPHSINQVSESTPLESLPQSPLRFPCFPGGLKLDHWLGARIRGISFRQYWMELVQAKLALAS